MKQKAVVIGAGFAGLSSACFLARAGMEVTVVEKNEMAGGRARSFSAQGYTWDMGPSWYWMPDVFERFFGQFGKRAADYYDLVRLDPSYRVVWEDEQVDIPAKLKDLENLFEQYETGSAERLANFLQECGKKYEHAMTKLVYQPGVSIREFMSWEVLSSALELDLLSSIQKHVRRYFSHPKLLQLVEFPILFLGALPQNTPALYSLMNYADMVLGTWYPMGGMVQIANGMKELATSLGVQFAFDEQVAALELTNKRVSQVQTNKRNLPADITIAACDYHHMESLLPESFRNYSQQYWDSRKMAPSSLLYYLGFSKKIGGLRHHNLFFDAPFDIHAEALYSKPGWPKEPLMYVCVPSKTDTSVAPDGCENLFVLIPTAPGLIETEELRRQYLDIAIGRIEARTGEEIREHLVYQRSYAGTNFSEDYNAFKGNAYGLANTLRQTALLKPSIRNKRLPNLFYTGQLTVPGPGVPPAIISGEIVARQALQQLYKQAQNAAV